MITDKRLTDVAAYPKRNMLLLLSIVTTILMLINLSLWSQEQGAHATPEVKPASAPATEQTAVSPGFIYKARRFKDPFLAPQKTAGSGTPMMASGASDTQFKSQEELQSSFDPSGLKLKAILADSGKAASIAVMADENDETNTFIIKGDRIQHVNSGFYVNGYRAAIEGQSVVLSRQSGESMTGIVGFPEKEDQ